MARSPDWLKPRGRAGILDDVLVLSADDRIEAMFNALQRTARDHQILVLTCRQRAFAALGGERAEVVVEGI